MLAALRTPIALGDQDVTVTASVGIAHATSDDTLERLLRHADTAMYAAKALGKDGYEVHDRDGALGAGASPVSF